MNIFLTGAAGFIGFHTADRLLGKGHNLLCIDDLNNHYDPSIKYKRIEFLKQKYKNKFQFERVDIRNKDELEKFFKNFDIEVVINLAARAGVRNSVKNPWIYYETNLTGVLNILELIGTTELLPFKVNKDKVYPEYLKYVLLSHEYLEKSWFLMYGKEHPRIHPLDLLSIKIPLPPKDVQEKIISEIQKQEEINDKAKQKLNDYRNQINGLVFEYLNKP